MTPPPQLGLGGGLLSANAANRSTLLDTYDGAAAAYSLQRLSSDTTNVVRVRRSTDDSEADMTVGDIDRNLRHFSLNNDADLIRFADQATAADKRMYFDGSNDYVTLTSQIDFAGDFDISFTALCTDITTRRGVMGLDTNNFIRFNSAIAIQLRIAGTNVFFAVSDIDDVQTYRLVRVGSTVELLVNGVSVGTQTISGTFSVDRVGVSYGTTEPMAGLIYDVDLGSASFNGYGNTNGDWEDTVGSNDGTVNGSPALFSGQGFDAFVTTLYDQSGALGQPLSRFAQHATSADKRMYFDGVNDYVTIGGLDLWDGTDFDLSMDVFIYDDSSTHTLLGINAGVNVYGMRVVGNDSIDVFFGGFTDGTNALRTASGVFTGYRNKVTTVRLTFISNTLTIYLDGSQVATGAVASHTTQSDGMLVGSRNPIPTETLNGIVYDVSVDFGNTGSDTNQWNGYGNTSADWEDQVGSNDGTVNGSPSIYEGRNALQSTASSQPQIVADGAVVTDSNGNASIDFISVTNVLETNSVLVSGTTARTVFAVVDANSVGVNESFLALSSESATSSGSIMNYTAETAVRVFGAIEFTNDPLTSLGVSAFVLPDAANITDMTFYLDGAQKTSTASSAATIDTQDTGVSQIGNYTAGGVYRVFDGKISEIIIYPSDQSANRAAIEANIANRYSITLA